MTSAMQHFQQQVYYWVKQIPYGKVTSYGQIARLAGFPRHARHVSKALGSADSSLQLPWHRVIAASGKIAFATDSDNFARQEHLLQQEAIKVIKGRINLQQYGWQLVEDISNNNRETDFTAEEFFK